MRRLMHSFLDLGDATSQNLDFAYRDDVHVSFGEETITETNLLELRRCHPGLIKLKTFTRGQESKNGADWEWHIIGRKWTFGMRVQAKRVQKNGRLKIKHKIGYKMGVSPGKQQIDVLISAARKGGMLRKRLRPVYCFYCSDGHQKHWATSRHKKPPVDKRWTEYGCLIADALAVKKIMPTKLSAIEKKCVPWHYLITPALYRKLFHLKARSRFSKHELLEFLEHGGIFHIHDPTDEISAAAKPTPSFPSVDQLNGDDVEFDQEQVGIWETVQQDKDEQEFSKIAAENGISRFLTLDIRELR